MSTISTSRASYQRPHVSFGQRKVAKKASLRVANDIEAGKINRMIDLLNQAKIATRETTFSYNLSEVFRLAREITAQHVVKS